MQTQDIIIFEPSTSEQANALKAFAKAFKLKFEVKEKPYNPEFVAKIEKSRQDFKEGKGTRLKKEDFKEFLGL
jgi:hypothetical protein